MLKTPELARPVHTAQGEEAFDPLSPPEGHTVTCVMDIGGESWAIGITEGTDRCLFIWGSPLYEPTYFDHEEGDLLIAAIRAGQRRLKEPV